MGHAHDDSEVNEEVVVYDGDDTNRETLGADDDDVEVERQCRDADHPTHAVDINDEWEYYNKKKRNIYI